MPTKKNKKTEEWICDICKSDPTKTKKDWTFKNQAGLMGHDSMVHKKPKTFDKITEQEKADLNNLSKLKDQMTSKESFYPAEIDEIKEKLKPLKTRQTLRDSAAEQSLRTQIAEDKSREEKAQKGSGADDQMPSWKEIMDSKKGEAMHFKGQDQSTALLQVQADNFKSYMETQKQISALATDSANKHAEYLKLEIDRLRKETSAPGKIEEIKAGAKLLGLTKKGDESDMSKMVEVFMSNLQHLPKIINAVKSQAASEALSKYGITPQPQVSNPNNFSNKEGQVISTPGPEIENYPPEAPIITNPEPQQTDLEYSKSHDLSDYGYDSASAPFGDMYADFNKNSPVNKSKKMIPSP